MSSAGDWPLAARLARATGFGGYGALVDQVAATGPATWVRAALQADPGTDPGVVATPPPVAEPLALLPPTPTPQQRQARRAAEKERLEALVGWWLRRMVAAANPITEKLTLGWHDHFATSARKVRSAELVLAQNETLRTLGCGSFTDLAHTMVTDPALLLWLDGQRNTAKAPNENLAREFLELFALGHGNGYTEQDVREGARALTGWTLDRDEGEVRFVAKRHDGGTKTVLGATGTLDATAFVDAILAEPGSARFLATRWWRRLAGPEPPSQDALDRLVAAYGPGRDLRSLFGAILTDPEYAGQTGTLVASPVEWVVGAMRSLAVPTDEATLKKAAGILKALGQLPFYPPNVSGWPSGKAWLSTSAAKTRVQAAGLLAQAGNLDAVAAAAPAERVDAIRYLLGLPAFTGRTASHLSTLTGNPRRLVAAALLCPENLVI
jgi:uncharacterized protein (DUF1800 family)